MNSPNLTSSDYARYQRLIESSNAISWEMDPQTQEFSYVCPQVREVFGYPVNAWHEPHFLHLHIFTDDEGWVIECFENAILKGGSHVIEYRTLKADGSILWVRNNFSLATTENNKSVLQGFMFDISDSKQAETVIHSLATSDSIKQSGDFFSESVRHLAEAYNCRFAFIGLLQESGEDVKALVVWDDKGIAENFQYNLKGTPCKDVLDFQIEIISFGATTRYPKDCMLKDMGIDSYYGAPIISSDGKTIGIVSVMDVRPMKTTAWSKPILGMFASRIGAELERKFAIDALNEINVTLENRVVDRTMELKQTTDEMESFCYSVSHDLRAPLRSIDGFSQVLLEEYDEVLDKAGKDFLNRICSSTKDMFDIIDKMLSLSQVTHVKIQEDNISLGAIADKAFNKLKDIDPGHNVTFINKNTDRVVGDKIFIQILLDNLIGNAWKYSYFKPNAIIEFGVIRNSKSINYFVKDNGVGFDMTYVDQLFLPFQRLHNDLRFEGDGIGLATVQRILRLHGGKIWAEAEPNKGATFFFMLPIIGCSDAS